MTLQCGVLLGALLLMSCAVMTTWSNMMLVNAANFVKKHTYGTLGEGREGGREGGEGGGRGEGVINNNCLSLLALASFGTVGKLATELW